MRTLPILFAALVLIVAISFTSCRPSRVYADNRNDKYENRNDNRYENRSAPAPSYRPSYSLIISPTPGFLMQRYPDGRFYHRNQAGMLYWKGYDNRFYLDRSFLSRVRYSQWEYNEWKRYSRSQGNRGRRY